MVSDERCWEIVTPEYDWPGWGWYATSEPAVDVVYVTARDRKDAKRRGIRALRNLYPHGWLAGGANPLNVKVHLAPTCPHGKKGDGWPTRDGADHTAESCALCEREMDDPDWESPQVDGVFT